MGAVERAFADRIRALPERSRRAVLLAAADDEPGARTAMLATPAADLAPAEADGLLRLAGDGLAFRHPLVRSAAYAAAPFVERRDAHATLAAALSGDGDADRRAWHRAAAAAGPDAEIADELARSAERARARGGHAAVVLGGLDEHARDPPPPLRRPAGVVHPATATGRSGVKAPANRRYSYVETSL